MPTYPYDSAGTWAAGQVLTAAEVTIINANAAAAADGSLWTDFAIARNWIGSATVADHGYALLWSNLDNNDDWYSFGVSGGNPTAKRKDVGGADFGGALTVDAGDGLTPRCAAGNTSILVMGGTPGSASTSKFRSSSNGTTWTARATVAASTEGVRGLCWHSGASMFIAGLDNTAATNIETSTDGITWTQRTGLANTTPRGSIASNGTTAVILPYNTSSNKCLSTANGTAYTERTLPATQIWHSVVWDPGHNQFVAFGASSTAYSTDGATWLTATGTPVVVGQCAAAYGRVIVWGQLSLSLVQVGTVESSAISDTTVLRTSNGIRSLACGRYQIMTADTAGVHHWTLAGGSPF